MTDNLDRARDILDHGTERFVDVLIEGDTVTADPSRAVSLHDLRALGRPVPCERPDCGHDVEAHVSPSFRGSEFIEGCRECPCFVYVVPADVQPGA